MPRQRKHVHVNSPATLASWTGPMRRFDIRWQNFRGLEDTGWIQVKPVTIVLGSNASGKTSLIAPLLILKQTLESAEHSLRLRTQGSLFNEGSFEKLVYE